VPGKSLLEAINKAVTPGSHEYLNHAAAHAAKELADTMK
jgi:hypothetical protein